MLQRFESFVTGITVCYKYLQRIKTAEMTEFGLKGTHVMCLFYLQHNPEGLTATQLSQMCAEDKAAISRALVIMQDKGLVYIPGEKRYRAQIRLTEAGMDMARQLDETIRQWVGFVGDDLTDEDRATFYRVLELLGRNLRENLEKTEGNSAE